MPKTLRDYEIYLVYVDPDKCDSCEECLKMCPTDVFEMPHKAIPVRPQNELRCSFFCFPDVLPNIPFFHYSSIPTVDSI
jgi:ferredoxin